MRIALNPARTRSVGHAGDIILTLVERELRIRYKGSVLGLLWAILSPLGTVAVMHVVFTTFLPLNIPNYAAFVYAGLLPWTWFQSVASAAAATLFDNRDLVRKPFFPRSVLPAVVAATNFILYLLALPVLIFFLIVEGVPLTPALLLLPAVWVVQGVFTLAFAIFVSAVGVIIRDVQHILGLIMTLWFYVTPIFYDAERVGEAGRWLWLNPLAVIVQAHRDIAITGTAPNWGALAGCLVAGFVLLVGSVAIFRALEDAFIEEV